MNIDEFARAARSSAWTDDDIGYSVDVSIAVSREKHRFELISPPMVERWLERRPRDRWWRCDRRPDEAPQTALAVVPQTPSVPAALQPCYPTSSALGQSIRAAGATQPIKLGAGEWIYP